MINNTTVLRYTLEGSFCSFRDPVAAKYQATFWFPPKTTVVGFLGCAQGLEPPDLEELYDNLQVGIIMESWGGIARDLWGFTKLKGSSKPETSVVIRELIYQPRYTIYVKSNSVGLLQKLKKYLIDPVYPLSFGRGEDLAFLIGKPQIMELLPVEEATWLYWTLLPFAIQDRGCVLEGIDSKIRNYIPPRSSLMPVSFHYNNKDWVRKVRSLAMTQVFNWGIRPASPEGLWTDGKYIFYLI